MTAQPTKNATTDPRSFDAVCYKRNFLTTVIARVDLATPIEPLGKELPKPLFAERKLSNTLRQYLLEIREQPRGLLDDIETLVLGRVDPDGCGRA